MSDLSLLPRDASRRERAISDAVAEWYAIPSEILDTLWDPRTCPEAVLPYLAWSVGLPLWSTAWNANKKRSAIAAWIGISRIRGTREGYRRALEIVDAELVDWVVPPAVLAPRPSITDAERQTFRAQYPELRVYAFPRRATRAGVLVPGRPWFGSRRCLQPSTAAARLHWAEVVDGGVTTPVALEVAASSTDLAAGWFTAMVPARAQRLVPGRPWFGAMRCPAPSTAAARVYQYSEGTARPDLLVPSATPISLEPDRVAQPHALPARLVPGRPWFGRRRATAPSVADQSVYDSIRLYDPDRPTANVQARRGGWFCGRGQLGQPRFRVTAIVDTKYQRPGGRFMPGKPLRGCVAPHDDSRTADVCAALRAASLGRDQVMLRTAAYRPVTPSETLLPGDALLPGQLTRTP